MIPGAAGRGEAVLVDVREPLAYAAGHLPGAMCLPVGMIPAFAGWFLGKGDRIALVASDEDQLAQAMTHLVRIGLDNVVGGYVGVVPAAAQGKAMRSIPMIGTEEVARRLGQDSGEWILLDVRDAVANTLGVAVGLSLAFTPLQCLLERVDRKLFRA